MKREKTGGRKAGTPNKATAQLRDLITDADPFGFLIEAVRFGRVPVIGADGAPTGEYESIPAIPRINAAVRLANKLAPDAKDRAITFDVGAIESIADAHKAMGKTIEALGGGDLSPSEASAVCGVIGQYIKSYEMNDLAERVRTIEAEIMEESK